MADPNDRHPDTVPGGYYVDTNCIDCDVCRDSAQENFRRNEEGGYSYVYKQPRSEAEREECERAREECPVDAIGDNG